MAKKYFVVSDIHSCYSALIKNLEDSGFDIDDPDHILISCGDIFDRGSESVEVYNFLKSLPRDRRILIRGNHEYLFLELYDKAYPEYHDISNGTVRTMSHFMNCSEYEARFMLASVNEFTKVREVVEWIKSDEWVNYYELDKYIFVHSFIPLNDESDLENYILDNHIYSYKEDWRTNTSDFMWNEATWGCPFKLFEEGLFKPETEKGKTLVYGHWHTFRIRNYYNKCEEVDEESLDHSIFFGDGQIGLDGCTPYTGKVNVLVIDDNGEIIWE